MLKTAIRFSLVFMLLTGLIYPLSVTGAAQVLFPHQANGSLIEKDGQVIGSELIGQAWTDPAYFHGRVSTVNYDASATGGANAGPTDQSLQDRVKASVEAWEQANPGVPVPPELVTNSGSGIDPHISPEAAKAQAPRVAKGTGIPEAKLLVLIDEKTESKVLGVLGEPRVNVLALNLALEELK